MISFPDSVTRHPLLGGFPVGEIPSGYLRGLLRRAPVEDWHLRIYVRRELLNRRKPQTKPGLAPITVEWVSVISPGGPNVAAASVRIDFKTRPAKSYRVNLFCSEWIASDLPVSLFWLENDRPRIPASYRRAVKRAVYEAADKKNRARHGEVAA